MRHNRKNTCNFQRFVITFLSLNNGRSSAAAAPDLERGRVAGKNAYTTGGN